MTDDEWTVDEAIENLKNAMKESGQSSTDLFSSIDANDDGEINGPELYKGLLEHLGDRLSPGQVSMIIKALDSNDDNRIDLAELTAALEEERLFLFFERSRQLCKVDSVIIIGIQCFDDHRNLSR